MQLSSSQVSPLTEDFGYLITNQAVDKTEQDQWLQEHRTALISSLKSRGALWFRGFHMTSPEEFRSFISHLAEHGLMDYEAGTTPRSSVSKEKVFTSTDYPNKYSIRHHCEQSYSDDYPTKLALGCLVAASSGGQTPICDNRAFTKALDPKIKERFQQDGVLYVRNFGTMDLSIEKVYGTKDPELLAQKLAQHGIEHEWLDDTKLRTKQRGPAMIPIPGSDELVWFNQANLFHVSSMDPLIQKGLIRMFGKDNLPKNAYYGDGSEIEDSVIAEINGLYEQLAIDVDWQPGDIAIVDNYLSTHARKPYEGERRVIVSLLDGVQHIN